jgi:glycosyltransferase involved in cell wall biosynthesis
MVRYIVTVSSIAGGRFFRFNGLPISQLQVIPYGVDVDLFQACSPIEIAELRRQIGLGPADIAVGSVGRLVEEKDYPTQFRAFAQAARQVDTLHMVLAGDGPLRESLCQLAQDLGILNRVHFLGLWERVPLLMRALDVFVLASKFETFGVALLEAKAAGLPTLASRFNEIPDIVRDGQDGMLFPVGDDAAFASLLIRLARDSGLRMTLGRSALDDARQRFSLQAVVGRHQQLYDQVCGSGCLE